MSAATRPAYRDLPPVDEPPPRPERMSMTLLSHADKCERAAYLYLRHGGGAPSPEMLRGSCGHSVFERMHNHALGQVIPEPQVDADTALALAEDEMERWPLQAKDRDDVRQMAWHMSVRSVEVVDDAEGNVVGEHRVTGYGLDPQKVVAVERKFVIPCGDWMVSCKLDLAAISGNVGIVDDFKTGFGLSTQEEVEQDFQLRVYAVALVHGHPVAEERCWNCEGSGHLDRDDGAAPGLRPEPCPICDERGKVEFLEDPMGGALTALRLGQVYPMLLDRDTGEVIARRHTITRLQVETDYDDLRALVRRFSGKLDSNRFDAIRGAHCTICPASGECPLPEVLRNHAGTINEPEQASEAAEWLDAMKAQTSAVQKELRNVVKARGPVRFGRDQELYLEVEESVSVDQDGLRLAVARAATFGEPVEWDAYRRPRKSTRLKQRTLSEDELEAEHG